MELVKSELLGVDAINASTQNIYSIGISSFLNAELAMLQRNPDARIIATTIDKKGLIATQQKLRALGENRIECKLEDVRQTLPYQHSYFDFIYARLVLHYLNKQQIKQTLHELKRTMNNDSKIYVVVRSTNEFEIQQHGTSTEVTTGMTTYPITNYKTGAQETITRRFYSEKLLTSILENAGFSVERCEEFEETLYKDFQRTKPNIRPNTLVAALARKPA